MGFSRPEYWSVQPSPSPGDFPNPGIKPRSPSLQADSFTSWATREVLKKESEVTQSCLTLCNPMDCSLPGSSLHGILQTRVLEWVAIPCSIGYIRHTSICMGFPWGSAANAGICNVRIHLQCRRPGFDPWVGKISWRRERLPTPVFWPGEFHGLYSPRGHKESDSTEWLSQYMHNGNAGSRGMKERNRKPIPKNSA